LSIDAAIGLSFLLQYAEMPLEVLTLEQVMRDGGTAAAQYVILLQQHQ
jgi:hypothetical protein